MKEGLVKAWTIHQEKNLLMLSHIEEANLSLALSPKGRSVGQQLAHLHNTRITWTEFVAKPIFDKTLLLEKNDSPTIDQLKHAFAISAKKIEEVIHLGWEKEGKLPGFKTGLIPFISYLISHESHHRGNILLTLKQSGVKLPDELKWGLWEWQK